MTPAIATAERPSLCITFEEFLCWEGEHQYVEWVDGKVQIRPTADLTHQRILGFLLSVLSLFVEERRLGTVLFVPFVMRLPLRPSGRAPDLIYIANANCSLIKYNYLNGPADLVLEIVSPESVARDYEEKYKEYAQNGVREYWCIDPEKETVLFCQLNAAGTYDAITLSAGRYDSMTVAGFWLQVEWLWQEPRPLQEALAALRLLGSTG